MSGWKPLTPTPFNEITKTKEEEERERLDQENRRRSEEEFLRRRSMVQPHRAGLDQMEWRDGALRSSRSSKLRW